MANNSKIIIKKAHIIRRIKENLEGYAYLTPAGIILFIFWAFPVLMSICMSFTNWKGGDSFKDVRLVGFTNYLRALNDEDFIQVLWNTLNYVIYSVPITLFLALFIAILLHSQIKLKGFFRTVYFLPFVTTWVAISIVWKYFFHREFGLANFFLDSIHTGLRLEWLSEPRGIWEMILAPLGINLKHPLLAGPSLAMFSIIITSVWRDVGYYMIIFLAGLQNIDRSYYEAAEIDGANGWQRFKTITIPLLSPVTFFLLIISMISAFKMFVPVLVMTATGGPDNTTSTIVFYLYQKGFRGLWLMGYASAIAYILFIIILCLTFIQNFVFGRKVHYGE